MTTSSDHELELWIAARKKDSTPHLALSVMREIQNASQPVSHPQPERPSWLLASACFIAGIGKLSLVFHFAF